MRNKRDERELGNMLDTFSDLPEDVIHNILSRLPLVDAVRTGILSSKWRHRWTNLESLILDSQFFEDYIDSSNMTEILSASTYKRIVGSILSSHKGKIRKFYLHVPYFDDYLNPSFIDMWIRSVSLCGVQDLTLEFGTHDPNHFVPSSLFGCLELKKLAMQFIEIRHPLRFKELSSLVSLDLHVYFVHGDTLRDVVSNCPVLESFSLSYDEEIDVVHGSFILNAPKLKLLSVEYYDYFQIIMEDVPNVSSISIERMVDVKSRSEDMNVYEDIVDYFRAVPKLVDIRLNGFFFVEWAEKEVPENVSTLLENHRNLIVTNLNMNSPYQLGSMRFLIRSSPNLQTLDISMYVPFEDDRNSMEYLQSQLREAENLTSLKTVKLTNIMGYEHEILFIEIILSRCPTLEKLYLHSRYNISPEAEYKMIIRILKLRRASTQAEVIYSKIQNSE